MKNQTIESILGQLDQLEKLHRSLLRIANEKTIRIKKNDISGLDQLLKDEQAHIAAILQTDKARETAVVAFFTEQGRSVPLQPTITDVLSIIQEPEQTQLKEAKDRLLHAIHELKWQNDLNQKLTYQSLQFVNLSLDMVRPRTESVNYSKNEIQGKQTAEKIASFDSQA
ncbi:flagellar protein FlgN [Sporosarcina sp. SAFN-010]|uniref:flagellar protein FlgN n=1 Tax=Sporosarcina sp. SAFN-010 TaxID=3387273 RepID=UPI003F811447